MKKLAFKITGIILAALFVASCGNNSNRPLKKSITGRAGEMVVVISKDFWKAGPGDVIRNTLAQPQVSLPQDEPLFNLVDVPHDAFNNIFRTTRNILVARISSAIDTPAVIIKNDIGAAPQATVEIKARDAAEFEKLLTENSNRIIAYFLNAEQKRLKSSYRKIHDKAVLNTLQKKFDVTMYCQPGFKIANETDDFIWYRYDTPNIIQGLFVYSLDYTSDSIFTPEYLIKKRDQMLKKYVHGELEGSYMTTEKRIEPIFNVKEHNGNYTTEMRGLWSFENDFMGGPYIMVAELDASNQRVVIADGFVYAPGKDKRNLLRQVEAMIYSMEFAEQDKNDKINSEVKMGN